MVLSVVIPAYNSADFIAETIGSVLCQTLPPDEVLVIDDGSTDNTADIAESFGPRVQVFRRKHSEQAASRNFGVQTAKGEWIAFVDADDIWETNKLERQISELLRHPDADVCYSAQTELIQDGAKAGLGKVAGVAPASEIRKALFRNTTFLPSTVVIRRSAFLAVGGFDTHYRVVQDWDLWLRLLHAGTRFAACQEPLVRYRVHLNNVTHKNSMAAFMAKEEIYQRHILPHLPASTRWLRRNKARSEHQSCAAYALRKAGDPLCLRMMAESILRAPAAEPLRYLVLAHIAYTHLRKRLTPVPSPDSPKTLEARPDRELQANT